eukprot:TRINITY_DN28547_c0_g1_i1.p1 TRINITY_DN28547_c0_g1~~TRINITY_DN28547_c0_g1_i1.p1  ORF type:complete len:668 (-),score=178.38 TRINITY_DN28547_c0_g1_i1:60-2063(-)
MSYITAKSSAVSPPVRSGAWAGDSVAIVSGSSKRNVLESPSPTWTVGEMVEVKRSNGKWVTGEVMNVTADSVQVQYCSDNQFFTKELDSSSTSIAKKGSNLLYLTIGESVEVRYDDDKKKLWVEAMVIGETDAYFEMQFYNKSSETTVELHVPKVCVNDVAPLGTHTLSEPTIPPPPPPDEVVEVDMRQSVAPPPVHDAIDAVGPPPPGLEKQPTQKSKRGSIENPPKRALPPRPDEIKDDLDIYRQADVLDVRDKQGKWYPAEVISVRHGAVYIHFIGFDNKWDQWLDVRADSKDIAPLGTKSDVRMTDDRYFVNGMVEVFGDFLGREANKWVDGLILKIDKSQVLVQYEDRTAMFRRWYFVPSNEIRLPGDAPVYSAVPFKDANKTPFQIGEYLEVLNGDGVWEIAEISDICGKELQLRGPFRVEWLHVDRDKHRFQELSKSDEELRRLQAEEAFKDEIKLKTGFEVEPIDKDGNCLYRSTAFLVYGDKEKHEMVRNLCFEYMRNNKDYFAPFIFGDFDEYIAANSKPCVWAGEPEIVVLAEMFNKQVEVYVQGMNVQPTIKMNDQFPSLPVLRFSYHGKSHYNAVIDPAQNEPLGDGKNSKINLRRERIKAVKNVNKHDADDGKMNSSQFDLNSTMHALRRLTTYTSSNGFAPSAPPEASPKNS